MRRSNVHNEVFLVVPQRGNRVYKTLITLKKLGTIQMKYKIPKKQKYYLTGKFYLVIIFCFFMTVGCTIISSGWMDECPMIDKCSEYECKSIYSTKMGSLDNAEKYYEQYKTCKKIKSEFDFNYEK